MGSHRREHAKGTATMTEPKYQLLDPLTEQQYADLKEDIVERGILTPVIVDEFGEVIDGHHRKQIAEELAQDYPTHQLQPGLSEADKLDASVALNLMGRHQSSEQKRETIRRYLLRRPEAADRYVARLIGVQHQTVGRIRVKLEAAGLIIQEAERATERLGKPYQHKVRQPKQAASAPDPEAVAKRQADLEAKRAKAEEKQAPKRAEQEQEEARWRADIEARGGSLREVSKPPARVFATQDRIKAAMNDCILTLIRALQDPGLDVDLIRAERIVSKDYRITDVHKRLQDKVKEFGAKLKELQDAEKASRMVRESPAREQ
jgi:ParB-like chromosome segregation protein Spo0J